MTFKTVASSAFGIVLVALLASCASLPSALQLGKATRTQHSERAAWQASYAELAKGGGRVYRLDPQRSAVRIYVFRAGAAAKLGHNHVIAAPKFTGLVYLPPTGAASARFDLEFRLDELEIDNLAFRADLGKAFASKPTPDAVAGTREHMLSDDNMQASRFPFVRIHSLQITGEVPKLAAEVQVEMHGEKRAMRVPLDVDGLPDRLEVSGALVLRQTDFGVRPYSALGGLLAVQDAVVIEFKLVGA